MGGGRNGHFWGAPIFGQNPEKYSIFPQKDAKSGRPKKSRSYHHPSHPPVDALLNRDSESKDSEARDSESGQIYGPLFQTPLRLRLTFREGHNSLQLHFGFYLSAIRFWGRSGRGRC